MVIIGIGLLPFRYSILPTGKRCQPRRAFGRDFVPNTVTSHIMMASYHNETFRYCSRGPYLLSLSGSYYPGTARTGPDACKTNRLVQVAEQQAPPDDADRFRLG